MLAISDPGSDTRVSYETLSRKVEHAAAALSERSRSLVFLFPTNSLDAIACYLGCLLANHALHLSSVPIYHPAAAALIERYRPELILWVGRAPVALKSHYDPARPIGSYQALSRRKPNDPLPNAELAILLSTSASTGNPKLVRLSRYNVACSAAQVCGSLGITESDRAFLSLPVPYVYGLSVLNSHLAAGASLVLDNHSPSDRKFWASARTSRVTSLPGVSYTFDCLRLLGLRCSDLPTIRTLTHSGDRLTSVNFAWMYRSFPPPRVRIYLMYGQTEATGRMCVLPPGWLPQKAGSVGAPVPWGKIAVDREAEITFDGPNVMMGYAERREDLARGHEHSRPLHTGDTGFIDDSGLLFITGRLNRVCKIHGQRINLGDVESLLRDFGDAAVVGSSAGLVVFHEDCTKSLSARVLPLARQLHVPPQCIELRRISAIPRGPSGKIDYRTLTSLVR